MCIGKAWSVFLEFRNTSIPDAIHSRSFSSNIKLECCLWSWLWLDLFFSCARLRFLFSSCCCCCDCDECERKVERTQRRRVKLFKAKHTGTRKVAKKEFHLCTHSRSLAQQQLGLFWIHFYFSALLSSRSRAKMLNSSQILIGWNWVNKRRDEIEIEFFLVKIFSHTIDSNDTWRERERDSYQLVKSKSSKWFAI